MADTKISALTEKTTTATGDNTVIVDSVGGDNKRVQLGNLMEFRLGGANAPSATELTYVKGLTSAAQTQLNDLDNAIDAVDTPPMMATTWLQTAADAASITPDADNKDFVYQANAQGAGTLTFNNPTGTPVNGQKLRIVVNATNGAQTLAKGTAYLASADIAWPATVGAGKIVEFGLTYVIAHWYLVALVNIV